MKLCLSCDLHLPFYRQAIQYDVLKWFVEDVKNKKPDCVIFAGDATSDGNEEVYDYFISTIKNIGLPFLYIPGNSDLRSIDTKNSIYNKSSKCVNEFGEVKIFAVNDSDDGKISNLQIDALNLADEKSVVFAHHPVEFLAKQTPAFKEWRNAHTNTVVFYGHMHLFGVGDKQVSLPAMDPDKSIGESPCVIYYDTETGKIEKSYFSCPVPNDLRGYFGVSCYDVEKHIEFALQNGLKHLELRPNVLTKDVECVICLIEKWREIGDTVLSVHLPEVYFSNDKVSVGADYEKMIDIAAQLKAQRLVQHVPVVSVDEIAKGCNVIEKIAEFIAKKLDVLPHKCIIGVENMHMTKKDEPNGNRRFGYVPEEVFKFMSEIKKRTKHEVGINFDVGHARNNKPYNNKYPISVWLAMLGKDIVSYHVHQVKDLGGDFENHTAIDSVYGSLISYASFFRCWTEEKINHAPLIFEMRTENAYEITLNTFKKCYGE